MQLVDQQDEDLSLGLSEQLYTARGSQALGLNERAIADFDLDLTDYTTQIFLKFTRAWAAADAGFFKRILWELQNDVFDFGPDSFASSNSYTNIPVASFLVQRPMDELVYYYLVIKLTDRDDTDIMNAIITDLTAAT